MKIRLIHLIKNLPLEGIAWVLGLTILAIYQPTQGHHFTLCLFNWSGFDFCPGCGLGRSISHFFHGEFAASIYSHPLGIPAVFILLSRTLILFRTYILTNNLYGQSN